MTTVPVTSGGNNLRIYGMKKLPIIITKEPTREEPKIPAMPYSLKPMESAAATKVKLVPITLGKRIPIGPKPLHWITVTTPEISSAAFTSVMVSSVGNFNTLPITKGTAIIPPSAASKCCAARSKLNPKGGLSSTV